MEKELDQLVEKLKAASGDNLKTVVLYGSAVTGEFHPKFSNLDVMCVLDHLEPADLESLAPVTTGWARHREAPPVFCTLEELRRSADVFAVELVDIKANHRVLYGEDVFATLEVPMTMHRVQVEHELRGNFLRLRQRYLVAGNDGRALLRLMTASISTFAVLFRHALIALGEQPPPTKRAVVERLAALLGSDLGAFHTILDVREGKRAAKDVEPVATFYDYLSAVTRVVEKVDERLGAGG